MVSSEKWVGPQRVADSDEPYLPCDVIFSPISVTLPHVCSFGRHQSVTLAASWGEGYMLIGSQ